MGTVLSPAGLPALGHASCAGGTAFLEGSEHFAAGSGELSVRVRPGRVLSSSCRYPRLRLVGHGPMLRFSTVRARCSCSRRLRPLSRSGRGRRCSSDSADINPGAGLGREAVRHRPITLSTPPSSFDPSRCPWRQVPPTSEPRSCRAFLSPATGERDKNGMAGVPPRPGRAESGVRPPVASGVRRSEACTGGRADRSGGGDVRRDQHRRHHPAVAVLRQGPRRPGGGASGRRRSVPRVRGHPRRVGAGRGGPELPARVGAGLPRPDPPRHRGEGGGRGLEGARGRR